ncbi:hypothetical protein FSP39_008570, partial [Pinctada imbricata]
TFNNACILVDHITGQSNDLVVSITTDGTYSIKVKDTTWLHSAPTSFVTGGDLHSSPGGDLKLLQTTGTSGQDLLGAWEDTNFQYQAGESRITASIRLYPKRQDNFLIFSQKYVDDAKETNVSSYDDIIGCFPSFKLTNAAAELGYMAFAGGFFGNQNKAFGRFNANTTRIKDGIEGGPIAIFDHEGNTIIISPFSEFMVASQRFKPGDSIGWGIMGGVKEVPKGYQYDTILYYSDGINKAFDGWGGLLRTWFNKTDSDILKDDTIKYMGYWTNNGGYYYYNTEKGKTYQDTIKELIQYANDTGIPYNYYQFDSWWYTRGEGNGTKEWEPESTIFPDGFKSKDNVYAIQNGGKFAFVIECNSSVSVPIQEEFWDSLFTKAQDWGMIMYEEDWMTWEYLKMESFSTNLILGKTWLSQMARSAQRHGIQIQYGWAYPREAMQSLEFPAVTQARVSGEYRPGHSEQWRIGEVSMFASALGVRPYKDTFWTTEIQPGNPEENRLSNLAFSLRCCTTDGQILRPSKPATAIDTQILQRAFHPLLPGDSEIWSTHTIYDATYHDLYFGTVLVVDPPEGYILFAKDLDFIIDEGEYMYYEYPKFSEMAPFNKSSILKLETRCNKTNPCLYHFVQKLHFEFHGNHSYYIIGEVSKWMTMSQNRIVSITPDYNAELMINMLGAPYEDVTLTYIEDGELKQRTCNLGMPGTQTMSLVTGRCPF